MSSPTETKIETRTIQAYEVEVWRNSWPDGAVTYSVMHEDEQVSGEDFNHIPTDDEVIKHLPGFTCGICGERVLMTPDVAVVLPRLRDHLEGHNPGASHLEACEVFEQFA